MKISFLGAADTVTGSKHLIDTDGHRVLLDAGLFQGYKVLRERNWQPVPPDLLHLDAVVLSHAHLDHSGWLPVLVRDGYRGPIYASAATRDLAEVLLLDSARLQEEDARRANRGGYSRHKKALPLYTTDDAQRAISRIKAVPAGKSVQIGKLQINLNPVGHLLGASAITLRTPHASLLFSGDVGRRDDVLMRAPRPLDGADVLLVESTYGNRLHPQDDLRARLTAIIQQTIERGGSVLMPSFAVGRAQALLHLLQQLRRNGDIPDWLPIYLDSPMAAQATTLYKRHRKLLKLSDADIDSLTDGVRITSTPQQSMRATQSKFPRIVIAASGMATGGRVLHHLKVMTPDARHHLVFPGFQVGGTRGAKILEGAPEIKIHGQYIPVRAEVSQLEGLSGHADSDGLIAWMQALRQPPRQVFVVHGEAAAADTLRARIKDELGWRACVPEQGQTVNL